MNPLGPPTHPELDGARNHKDSKTGESYLIQKHLPQGILIMEMNRLKSKNGFDDWMYLVMADAMNEAAKDESVLVVIITANGEYFSSGADLRAEMQAGESLKLGKGNALDPVGVFMRVMLRFPKPLIAAVNGPAIGVGCTMLGHCDIAYASETASFLAPFTRIAVVPEFCSSVLFPKNMGASTANEMLLLGKTLTAQRAKQVGFVSEVFPQQGFMDSVLKEVQAGLVYPLLDKTLPLFKNMIKRWDSDALENLCLYELKKLDERGESGEIAEAVVAFMRAGKKTKGSKL